MGLEWDVRVKSINALLISSSTVCYPSVQKKKEGILASVLLLTTCLHYGIDINYNYFYLIKI